MTWGGDPCAEPLAARLLRGAGMVLVLPGLFLLGWADHITARRRQRLVLIPARAALAQEEARCACEQRETVTEAVRRVRDRQEAAERLLKQCGYRGEVSR